MQKTFLGLFALLLIGFCSYAFYPSTPQTKEDDGITRLQIGDKLPLGDLKMMDISDKELSLNDIMGENGLILNFSCNTCPFVLAYEDRYPDVEKLAKESGLGLALINSNEAKRQGSKNEDTMDAMKAHAKELSYDCYYLLDKNHQLADAIGAFTTPHIFLFNKDQELVYKGGIDDNWRSKEEAKEAFLANAVSSLLSGKKIDPAETKGRGCSIKRLK